MKQILVPSCPKTQEILDLFQAHGHVKYRGNMSLLSHAFQTGILAREQGMDGDMIVAALLHDIGHLVSLQEKAVISGNLNLQAHDQLGADYLDKLGFSQAIVATCRNHIRAKRYLCFENEAYYLHLSESSKKHLDLQGGPLSLEEAMVFEADPFFQISLDIRYLDEQAEVEDFEPTEEDWQYFAHMIEIHLA